MGNKKSKASKQSSQQLDSREVLINEIFNNTNLIVSPKQVTFLKLKIKDAECYFYSKFDCFVYYNSDIFSDHINVINDNFCDKIGRFRTNRYYRVLIEFDSLNFEDGSVDFDPLFMIILEKYEVNIINHLDLSNLTLESISDFFSQLVGSIEANKSSRKYDSLFFLLPNADYVCKIELSLVYVGRTKPPFYHMIKELEHFNNTIEEEKEEEQDENSNTGSESKAKFNTMQNKSNQAGFNKVSIEKNNQASTAKNLHMAVLAQSKELEESTNTNSNIQGNVSKANEVNNFKVTKKRIQGPVNVATAREETVKEIKSDNRSNSKGKVSKTEQNHLKPNRVVSNISMTFKSNKINKHSKDLYSIFSSKQVEEQLIQIFSKVENPFEVKSFNKAFFLRTQGLLDLLNLKYHNRALADNFRSFINKTSPSYFKFISNFAFSKCLSKHELLKSNKNELEFLRDVVLPKVPNVSMLVIDLEKIELFHLKYYICILEYLVNIMCSTDFRISSLSVKFVINEACDYSNHTNHTHTNHDTKRCENEEMEEWIDSKNGRLNKQPLTLPSLYYNEIESLKTSIQTILMQQELTQEVIRFVNFEIVKFAKEDNVVHSKEANTEVKLEEKTTFPVLYERSTFIIAKRNNDNLRKILYQVYNRRNGANPISIKGDKVATERIINKIMVASGEIREYSLIKNLDVSLAKLLELIC